MLINRLSANIMFKDNLEKYDLIKTFSGKELKVFIYKI